MSSIYQNQNFKGMIYAYAFITWDHVIVAAFPWIIRKEGRKNKEGTEQVHMHRIKDYVCTQLLPYWQNIDVDFSLP